LSVTLPGRRNAVKEFDSLRFNDQGLIPVIIQDAGSREPLTLAYMNREALEKTVETGKIHLFRRSHGKLMMKGEQSGMTQDVEEVRVDCSNNSLLIRVRPKGPGCHEGYFSCYYRRLNMDAGEWETTEERGFDPQAVYGQVDK
jgi:phosphoribosyl-AMP cyclohydrolase